MTEPPAYNLRLLTLTNLDIPFNLDQKLENALGGGKCVPVLENLVVRSCSTHDYMAEWELKGQVSRVTWEDVVLISSETETETETEAETKSSDDEEIGIEDLHNCCG